MAKKKEPDFEENLRKLEEIALKLESGEMRLEEAMEQYEQGVKLYRRCHDILKVAQKKVQMLVRDENGKLQAVPFEEPVGSADESPGGEESDSPSVSPPRPGRKPRGSDLF